MKRFFSFLIIFFAFIFSISSFWHLEQESDRDSPEINFPSPEIIALRTRIDNILEPYLTKDYQIGLKVISLTTPQVLYSYNDEQPLTPASNLKLITTSAAYNLLGSNFIWQTDIYADDDNNIYLQASGDPTFTAKGLESLFKAMADSLRYYRSSRIRGNFYVDQGSFHDSAIGYGWRTSNLSNTYSSKPTALAFEENCAQVVIKPTKINSPPVIEIFPVDTGFEIVNKSLTTPWKKEQNIIVAVDSLANKLVISGRIWEKSKPQWRSFAVQKPDLYALSIVGKKLQEQKMIIEGGVHYTSLREEAYQDRKYQKLFTIQSGCLQEVISEINQKSNNFMANQLYLTIGQKVGLAPQSHIYIKQFLTQNKIDSTSLTMYDGSGLSRYNQCSPDLLVQILKFMANSPDFTGFYQSLAVTGTTGTLKAFKNPLLANKVHAKTGYIIGARALSGYLMTQDGNLLAFSFMINKEKSQLNNFYDLAEQILLELVLLEKATQVY